MPRPSRSATYSAESTQLTATSNTSGVGSTRSYTSSYDAAGQQRVQQIVGNASAAYTTTLDSAGRATSLSEAFLPGTPFTATWTYKALT